MLVARAWSDMIRALRGEAKRNRGIYRTGKEKRTWSPHITSQHHILFTLLNGCPSLTHVPPVWLCSPIHPHLPYENFKHFEFLNLQLICVVPLAMTG
eukprot:c14956_g1_i1 orf=1408-1698(-)